MWFFALPTNQRRALLAAMLGWMFDAMDFLIYVLAIARLKTYFGFGDATAGLLGTLTLISAAIGGKYHRPGRSITGSAGDWNDVSPEKTATLVGCA